MKSGRIRFVFPVWAALAVAAVLGVRAGEAFAGKKAQPPAHAVSAAQIESLEALVRANPENVKAMCDVGAVFVAAGRYKQAVELFRIANKANPDVAIGYHLYYGTACNETGLFQDALTIFKEAIQLAPKDADLYCGLGRALARLKLPREAVAAYQQALKFKKNHARAGLELGLLYGDLGRYGEAEPLLTKAARTSPGDYMAQCGLGFVESGLGRQQEAIPAFRQAAAIGPEDALAHYGLGAALIRGGLYKAAAEEYKQAASADPDYSHAFLAHGLDYGGFGRAQETAEILKTVLQIDSNDAYAYFNLGVLDQVSGDYYAAFAQYKALKPIDQALADDLFRVLFP